MWWNVSSRLTSSVTGRSGDLARLSARKASSASSRCGVARPAASCRHATSSTSRVSYRSIISLRLSGRRT
ncbi:Uncharacterised protein [Bordetella pertussis]|nr:Uncharacterised protein [Bordetella pertussis]